MSAPQQIVECYLCSCELKDTGWRYRPQAPPICLGCHKRYILPAQLKELQLPPEPKTPLSPATWNASPFELNWSLP